STGAPAAGAGAVGAESAGAAADDAGDAGVKRSASSLRILPPGPVPGTLAGSRPRSSTIRRTAGQSAGAPAGGAGAAPPGAEGAAAGAAPAAAGAPPRAAAAATLAGAAATAGAAAVAAPSAIRPSTSPTFTTSPGVRACVSTPDASATISTAALSV